MSGCRKILSDTSTLYHRALTFNECRQGARPRKDHGEGLGPFWWRRPQVIAFRRHDSRRGRWAWTCWPSNFTDSISQQQRALGSEVVTTSHEELIFKTLGLADCQTFQQLRNYLASYRVSCWHRSRRPANERLAKTPFDDNADKYSNKRSKAISGNLWSIASSIRPAQTLATPKIVSTCLWIGSSVGETPTCAFIINRNGTDESGATINNLIPDVLLRIPSGILAFQRLQPA